MPLKFIYEALIKLNFLIFLMVKIFTIKIFYIVRQVKFQINMN